MYHKLGRPRRTTKAQMICINEPDSEPVYYKIDSKGNIIDQNASKTMVEIRNNINEKVDKQTVSYENSNNALIDDKFNKENDDDIFKLTDINYFLNKKPFPSLIDFEIDSLILPNQILVVT